MTFETDLKLKPNLTGLGAEIEPIYSDEKLTYSEISRNPILKPISEISKIYESLELQIIRALWEFGKVETEIDNMIKINPRYSQTILMSKIQTLLIYIKQVIHNQDIQKFNMKRAINEMVHICEKEYAPLSEEFKSESEEIIKDEVATPMSLQTKAEVKNIEVPILEEKQEEKKKKKYYAEF